MNAKISVFTIIASFALLLASCNKDDDKNVPGIQPPKLIQDSFKTEYPGIQNPEWKVAGNYYVADFENDSTEVTAWFAQTTGQWLMEKADLRVTLIPDDIIDTIQQGFYTNWMIEDAYTIKRVGMGTVYEVEVQLGNQDTYLYFSEYGNLIKTIEEADNHEDEPLIIPEQVASLMQLTFADCQLLDIQSNSKGYILNLLDGDVYKIAQLNSNYIWQSTSYGISQNDVPQVVANGFDASAYANDNVQMITVVIEITGTFYLFTVNHNNQSIMVKFNSLGQVV